MEVAAAGPEMLSRVPYYFQRRVNALEVGELRARLPGDATIERMIVRFYPGPELNLIVDPFIELPGNVRQELIQYTGPRGISGDNDMLEFRLSLPVRLDTSIVVGFNNLHATLAYNFIVMVEVDFADGVWRWPFRLGSGGGK